MSFSSEVKEELNSIHIKGNCCKKAYILGALMSAEADHGKIRLRPTDSSTAEKLIFLLHSVFNIKPETQNINRGCFSAVNIEFTSKKLSQFIYFIDRYNDIDTDQDDIELYFGCEHCKNIFLMGVFCACGTVSDPKKSYTLELRTPNNSRAAVINRISDDLGLPSFYTTQRKGAVGVFFRNESDIEDFLTVCGVNKTLFKFFDVHIEKDIRNMENRATNCVTRNISKSVDAATLQISAIEALIKNKAFDEMSPEIKMTANLRLENPDISLAELCELHEPKISKSGINHRLSKLVEEAKRRKLI